jgi:hypothetical protein
MLSLMLEHAINPESFCDCALLLLGCDFIDPVFQVLLYMLYLYSSVFRIIENHASLIFFHSYIHHICCCFFPSKRRIMLRYIKIFGSTVQEKNLAMQDLLFCT